MTAELTLIFEADRPLAGPARVPLGGIDALAIGRGQREVAAAGREAWLRVPDPLVSARHAALERDGARWLVRDLGSKNGTFVNGRRVASAPIAPGDLLELGGSFFTVRSGVGLTPWLDAQLPALRTIVPAVAAQLDALARAAGSDDPVLIRGGIGAGKELAARALHTLSALAGPFVPVSCGALWSTERGGESWDSLWGQLVRDARGGALFLDAVDELTRPAQLALARMIAACAAMAGQGRSRRPIAPRVVCATHADLEYQLAAGALDVGLYRAIHRHCIALPRLRDRREDFGLIAGSLLRTIAGRDTRVTFRPVAARALLMHSWPRNVRELEQTLRSAVAAARGGPIALYCLPDDVRRAARCAEPPASYGLSEPEVLRGTLARLLSEHDGNIAAVARAMGKQRAQVHRWIARLDLETSLYRRARARGYGSAQHRKPVE